MPGGRRKFFFEGYRPREIESVEVDKFVCQRLSVVNLYRLLSDPRKIFLLGIRSGAGWLDAMPANAPFRSEFFLSIFFSL